MLPGQQVATVAAHQLPELSELSQREVFTVLNGPPVLLFYLAADELKIPKIMQDLKDKKANKGAKAFFQVKIRGEPTPTVKW